MNIRVKDNGIGMSQEFVQKIFSPFERERTSTVSRIQGRRNSAWPLPEYCVYDGGTIEVLTEQGKGTEFIVRLPFRIQSSTKLAGVEVLGDPSFTRNTLVVDDDFNTCDSVTKMLAKVGMRSNGHFGKEAVLGARRSAQIGSMLIS